jgi:magnesium transporter
LLIYASPFEMLKVFHALAPVTTTIDADDCSAFPAETIWIDLLDPSPAEEQLVERIIGHSIPTREEMAEIETSSRLYEADGVLYLTATVLTGLATDDPVASPISFVVTPKHLITVRYANPKPFLTFADYVARQPALLASPMATFIHLLDAIVDRMADAFEQIATEVDTISKHVFRRSPSERGRRIPALKLEALLIRIGMTHDMLAKSRETAGSTARLLTFTANCRHLRDDTEQRDELRSLAEDVDSLIDHSSFLANNVTFLLDASLGLINIEQNAILKIFSVASVMLLPPTLVGAVYGMNFDHMPELKWVYGYPIALGMMLLSAVLPYVYFRRRGWL